MNSITACIRDDLECGFHAIEHDTISKAHMLAICDLMDAVTELERVDRLMPSDVEDAKQALFRARTVCTLHAEAHSKGGRYDPTVRRQTKVKRRR